MSDIIKFIVTHPEMSNCEVGRQLGVSESTVRRHKARVTETGQTVPEDDVPVEANEPISGDRIPQDYMDKVLIELCEEPLVVEGNAAICADNHAPLFSVPWTNDLVDMSQRWKLRQLIIAGDFNNQDALSKYFPKQLNAGKNKERAISRHLLAFFLRIYEQVWVIPGNHDDRLVKAQGYKKSYIDSIAEYYDGIPGFERLHVSNLDHIWLRDTNNGIWYICHPQAYSTNPLVGATTIAELNDGANVVTAHSHHAAMGYAKDGDRVVAEIGGLFDARRTAYLNKTTTYRKWVNGYGWVQDGMFGMNTPLWRMR